MESYIFYGSKEGRKGGREEGRKGVSSLCILDTRPLPGLLFNILVPSGFVSQKPLAGSAPACMAY